MNLKLGECIIDFKDFISLSDKDFCKEIMKRPGMYVGESRLDYIRYFLSGYCICKMSFDTNDDWDENYELQYWVMTNQSACIRRMASLNGWTLFFNCFGIRTIALMNFSRYLHDEIPSPPNIDDRSFHERCAAHDVYTLVNKLEKENEDNFISIKHLIVGIIGELIGEVDTNYDDIRVYVYRDTYFSQIRFVFHTPNGWHDDCNIINKTSNYNKLVKLHAAVECVEDKDIKNLNKHDERIYFYLNYGVDSNQTRRSIFNVDIADELTLQYKYQNWKELFTCTY